MANAKKPKGEWVATDNNQRLGIIIACSVCKKKRRNDSPNPESCPNCGATMTNASGFPKNWSEVMGQF